MTAYEAFEVSAKAVRTRLERWEMRVDGVIHALAIVAAIVGGVVLLVIASRRGGAGDVAAVAIYAAGVVTMFGCSAAFNLGRYCRRAELLRRLDQGAIFLMIAGTYTPFTVLDLEGAWSWSFTSAVWSITAVGIVLRFLPGGLFDRIAIGFYLLLGWLSLVALPPLIHALDTAALVLLAIGGVLYTVGVVFHLWQKLPFQNVIWHVFVVAAAATHFAAVAVSVAAAGSS